MEIIKGNLITLAKEGMFDVIGHGVNCFCRMKRGIAPQMAEAFDCHTFKLEHHNYTGDINKLGCIDYEMVRLDDFSEKTSLFVVNMYTQYHWVEPSSWGIPLDYDALKMCFTKINHVFSRKHIGLPWVGCGRAGGNKLTVECIIEEYLNNCKVTIVEYEN